MHRTLRKPSTVLLAVCMLGSLAMSANAEETSGPAAPARSDCSSAKHQKLRMLLGEWTVSTDGDKTWKTIFNGSYTRASARPK